MIIAGIQAAYSAGIDVICIPDMKAPGELFRKIDGLYRYVLLNPW